MGNTNVHFIYRVNRYYEGMVRRFWILRAFCRVKNVFDVRQKFSDVPLHKPKLRVVNPWGENVVMKQKSTMLQLHVSRRGRDEMETRPETHRKKMWVFCPVLLLRHHHLINMSHCGHIMWCSSNSQVLYLTIINIITMCQWAVNALPWVSWHVNLFLLHCRMQVHQFLEFEHKHKLQGLMVRSYGSIRPPSHNDQHSRRH